MTKTANRVIQFILWILMAASVVLFVFFYINGEPMADTVLTWAQILLVITVALLIIFPIIHFIKNPKSALKFLIVIAIFGVLFLISYLFATGNIKDDIYVEENITSSVSRIIGSGLIMVYILAGIAVLSIIISAIINAFK